MQNLLPLLYAPLTVCFSNGLPELHTHTLLLAKALGVVQVLAKVAAAAAVVVVSSFLVLPGIVCEYIIQLLQTQMANLRPAENMAVASSQISRERQLPSPARAYGKLSRPVPEQSIGTSSGRRRSRRLFRPSGGGENLPRRLSMAFFNLSQPSSFSFSLFLHIILPFCPSGYVVQIIF